MFLFKRYDDHQLNFIKFERKGKLIEKLGRKVTILKSDTMMAELPKILGFLVL